MFATQNPDLLDWFIALVQMKKDVVAQGLWVGMGLSAIYFLVMLLTQWGDRHTLAKALVFSGLIHLVSVAGVVAVVATPETNRKDVVAAEEKQEPSTSIQLLSEDPQDLPNEGNTPVWNRLPAPVETLMARIDQKNLQPIPFEDPSREAEPAPKETEAKIPDLQPALPEEQPEVPQPERVEQKTEPRTPVNLPMEEPETIAVPDRDSPKKVRERNPIPARGPFETVIDRAPMHGATDQVKREVDPNREFASIETPDNPAAYLKRGPESDVMKHRTSPAPAFAPLPDLGAPILRVRKQRLPACGFPIVPAV